MPKISSASPCASRGHTQTRQLGTHGEPVASWPYRSAWDRGGRALQAHHPSCPQRTMATWFRPNGGPDQQALPNMVGTTGDVLPTPRGRRFDLRQVDEDEPTSAKERGERQCLVGGALTALTNPRATRRPRVRRPTRGNQRDQGRDGTGGQECLGHPETPAVKSVVRAACNHPRTRVRKRNEWSTKGVSLQRPSN